MDCYAGGDVPYVTGIGVAKTATPSAYIISAPKGNTNKTSWVRKQLATTDLLSSYLPLSGGTLTGKLTINPTNALSQFDEGIRINTASSKYAGILFGGTGTTSPTGGWWVCKNPSDNFTISWQTNGTNNEGLTLYSNGNRPKWKTNDLAYLSDITWDKLNGKPNTFTPASHTHSASDITSGTLALARIPTGTSSSTVALGNHTHSYAGSASAGGSANALATFDTRNDNFAPNSSSLKKNAITSDFKYISKIGSPSGFAGTYCGVMNFMPWSESSGGAGYQLAFGYSDTSKVSPKLALRCADLSATAWGSWVKVYTSVDKPTPSEIGAAAASHTHTLSQISDLDSSWDAILKASATSATFTPKAHNQASNTITAMTGYVKGSSQAAISTSDSLNTAIAKLEVKADSKLTTTSSSAGQATNMIVVTELPSSPAANTLYLIVEA